MCVARESKLHTRNHMLVMGCDGVHHTSTGTYIISDMWPKWKKKQRKIRILFVFNFENNMSVFAHIWLANETEYFIRL